MEKNDISRLSKFIKQKHLLSRGLEWGGAEMLSGTTVGPRVAAAAFDIE